MPKVFLCHSSADKPFVRELADSLAQQTLSVWIDEKEILVGDPIREKIEDGLRDSDYLAIVLSPDAVNSAWVQKELDSKLIEEIESKRVTVLPILHRDCAIPPFLKGKHYADFRSDKDAGLRELIRRFQPRNIELEIKQQVLNRLAGELAARADPHLIIPLAITAGDLDGAEKLIAEHVKCHLNCNQIPQLKAMLATSRHSTAATTGSWIRAIDATVDLIRNHPVHQNVTNLYSIAGKMPIAPECLACCQRHIQHCMVEISAGKNTWAPLVAAPLIHAARNVGMPPADMQMLCQQCQQIINLLSVSALRPIISNLVNSATHVANNLPDPDRMQSMASILNAAEPKFGDSHEYSDGYLHLAWAAAILGKSNSAAKYCAKYKPTVPAQMYAERLGAHHGLAEAIEQSSRSLPIRNKRKRR